MTEHYTHENFRENAQIRVPVTTSTDGESLVVPVVNLINQFSLSSKLVGINSDGRTNLAIFKAILESTFDNTVVFDLGEPMFMMEWLECSLANSHKKELMDVQSDDGRLYTEVNRRNMQHCITWTKNHKGGGVLWRQRRSMWDLLVRGLLHLSKIVLPI